MDAEGIKLMIARKNYYKKPHEPEKTF